MMIVLVGFMGAGKTTVGRLLAERLSVPFVDSDAVVEQRFSRTVRDIFETEGEAWFRDTEHSVIAELVQAGDAVLALGGGALGDARTRAVLGDATVVYLDVGFAEAIERVGGDANRPMLRRPGLEELHGTRAAIYREAADVVVGTDRRPPGDVAAEILGLLPRAARWTGRCRARPEPAPAPATPPPVRRGGSRSGPGC